MNNYGYLCSGYATTSFQICSGAIASVNPVGISMPYGRIIFQKDIKPEMKLKPESTDTFNPVNIIKEIG